jgi:hypothetical protein
MCRQRRADIPVRLLLQEAGWKTRSPLRGGSGLESLLSFEKPHREGRIWDTHIWQSNEWVSHMCRDLRPAGNGDLCRHQLSVLAVVIDEAKRLSATHTLTGGHRGFDMLHVAAALQLKARHFLTFDANQKRLAEAEGLIVPF